MSPSDRLRASGPMRWIRGLRPDGNALRRRTDRTETAVIMLITIVFLAVAPLAARLGSDLAYRGVNGARQVQAVVLSSPPGLSVEPYGGQTSLYARARWPVPAGGHRTGQISAPTGAMAGSKVTVWIDAQGSPILPPGQLAASKTAAACLAVFIAFAVAAVACRAVRGVMLRRRLAAWEAEWRAVEPRWTTRR
jgi:hypothetical protein